MSSGEGVRGAPRCSGPVAGWFAAGMGAFPCELYARFPGILNATLLREWILFYTKDDELKKSVLLQHRTRAVEKVIERCFDPKKTRGLVWHTQGSGKTFTMITAARLLLSGQHAGTTPNVCSRVCGRGVIPRST